MKNKKDVSKMSFQEYWDNLKETNEPMYYIFKRKLIQNLGLTDATLRYRKRKMKFYKAERTIITELIRTVEHNQNINSASLFPNSIEQYA